MQNVRLLRQRIWLSGHNLKKKKKLFSLTCSIGVSGLRFPWLCEEPKSSCRNTLGLLSILGEDLS